MKIEMFKAINGKVAAFVLISFVLGYGLRTCRSTDTENHDKPEMSSSMADHSGHAVVTKKASHSESSSTGMKEMMERKLKLTPAAEQMAEVRTVPVQRKFVEAEIRMVGKVEYDETRVGYITAWVPGRIDQLYIDYTGIEVKEGDHMVYLYSPELIAAQEELLAALKTVETLKGSDSTLIRGRVEQTVKSSRGKLKLLGLTEDQITGIEERGAVSDHLTIYSPMGGVVVHKNAQEGMYVQTGTRIYTIADLSHLWVQLDAYESDLQWIRYGQEVDFETEAYPGVNFKGRISFIDPILNSETRTVKVRVNVKNPDGKLKPEMFVHAVVRSRIAAGGKVMDPSLIGKWIGSMHPEIITDEPGKCPICGEQLVKAESLGYVSITETEMVTPLVIPDSAPLVTGTRAVVYVKVPDEPGVYEGRVIELGPLAGNYYIVKSGLEEGELVVTRGNFKIDSAVQIKAKASMMNPEGGGPMPGHSH